MGQYSGQEEGHGSLVGKDLGAMKGADSSNLDQRLEVCAHVVLNMGAGVDYLFGAHEEVVDAQQGLHEALYHQLVELSSCQMRTVGLAHRA